MKLANSLLSLYFPCRAVCNMPVLPSFLPSFPLVLFMRSHNVTYKSNSNQQPTAPFLSPGVIKTTDCSFPLTKKS